MFRAFRTYGSSQRSFFKRVKHLRSIYAAEKARCNDRVVWFEWCHRLLEAHIGWHVVVWREVLTRNSIAKTRCRCNGAAFHVSVDDDGEVVLGWFDTWYRLLDLCATIERSNVRIYLESMFCHRFDGSGCSIHNLIKLRFVSLLITKSKIRFLFVSFALHLLRVSSSGMTNPNAHTFYWFAERKVNKTKLKTWPFPNSITKWIFFDSPSPFSWAHTHRHNRKTAKNNWNYWKYVVETLRRMQMLKMCAQFSGQ